MKEFFRRTCPRSFATLRGIKDQFLIEGRTLKTAGVAGVITALRPRACWEEELPVQSVRRVSLPGLRFATFEELLSRIEISGSGVHSVYMDPGRWAAGPLAPLRRNYPEGSGLKVMRRLGGVEVPYMAPAGSGVIQEHLLPSHRQQTLTMNYLHAEGLAPRLYDLLEISGGENACVGYVVAHAPGGKPEEGACREVVGALRQLVATGSLQLINWYGFEDRDFRCPDCNGNLRTDAEGRSVYVDAQNFRLANYGRYLMETIRNAQDASHFGDCTHLLGGRYLYQAVPGVRMPAKRDPVRRMAVLSEMLAQAGMTIEGRAVLDVGCNLGLMGAQYLKNGASWVHGWDLPEVVKHTHRILSATGCTRFSLTGARLGPNTALSNDCPAFLGSYSKASVVSYLAIRGHVGWLPALQALQWSHMIYEGHEEEGVDASRAHISDLSQFIPIQILAERQIADGMSRPRYAALIKRQG